MLKLKSRTSKKASSEVSRKGRFALEPDIYIHTLQDIQNIPGDSVSLGGPCNC